jgi:hypothetical protein
MENAKRKNRQTSKKFTERTRCQKKQSNKYVETANISFFQIKTKKLFMTNPKTFRSTTSFLEKFTFEKKVVKIQTVLTHF